MVQYKDFSALAYEPVVFVVFMAITYREVLLTASALTIYSLTGSPIQFAAELAEVVVIGVVVSSCSRYNGDGKHTTECTAGVRGSRAWRA